MSLLCNFKKIATETTLQAVYNDHRCTLCSHPDFQEFTNMFGHISTADPRFVRALIRFQLRKAHNTFDTKLLEQLYVLFAAGAKFAIPVHFSEIKFMNEFILQLDTWMTKLETNTGRSFLNMRNLIIERVEIYLHCLDESNAKSPFDTEKLKQFIISELHPRFVVSLVDKAPRNFHVSCIHFYTRALHFQITGERLSYYNIQMPLANQIDYSDKTNRAIYEKSDYSTQEFTDKQTRYVSKYGTVHVPKLPYIYMVTKIHKEGRRGITSCKDITIEKLSRILHIVLTFLIKYAEKDALSYKLQHGTQWFWNIESYLDVNRLLTFLNNDPAHIPSSINVSDIGGAYDRLPH